MTRERDEQRLERVRQVVRWLMYERVVASQRHLAAEMGYNAAQVSQVLGGKAPVTPRFVHHLCDVDPRIDEEWVLEGNPSEADGPAAEEPSGGAAGARNAETRNAQTRSAEAQERETRNTEALRKGEAPYYHDLPVTGGRVEQWVQDAEPSGTVSIPGVGAEAYFPVVGCSMEPTIQQGDMVGVRRLDGLERLYPDKVYMVVTRDGERMIKHIIPSPTNADELLLLSDNPDYPPSPLRRDQVVGIWRVVFAGRRM